MLVPCGRCFMCRIARASEWAVRLTHESFYHDKTAFITWTYDNEHLPDNNSIDKKEMQKYIKKLRRTFQERRLRYYLSGEYGSNYSRPHYHAIVYGVNMLDKPEIEKSWSKGIVDVQNVTYDTCRYVASYVFDKYSKKAIDYIGDRQKPFQLQSLGIGKQFALDNANQIKENLELTLYGKKVSIPRYYKKVLELPTEELYEKRLQYSKDLEDEFRKRNIEDEIVYGKILTSRRQIARKLQQKNELYNSRHKKL